MSKNLGYYCQKLSRLNLNRSRDRGVAPHKPILLLSVIDLVEQGILKYNRIFLSPELIATFLKFWGQLASDAHRSNIALPFFHLKGDGFWHFKANPGYEAAITSQDKAGTINSLRQSIHYAYLDNELFELLQEPRSRYSLVSTLINTWFSNKQRQIEHLLNIDALQDFEYQLRQKGGAVYQLEDLNDEAKAVVRDAAFRRVVVSIYNHRCAFCGLQAINSLGYNLVDGAHIKPFSQFYDDRIDNGISLCKNHHWAFDHGWFAINNDYTLLISDELREESPNSTPMKEFYGRSIWLPERSHYYPRIEALQWHRENIFNLKVS